MGRLRRAEAERGTQEWRRRLVGPRCGSGWELEGGSMAPGGPGEVGQNGKRRAASLGKLSAGSADWGLDRATGCMGKMFQELLFFWRVMVAIPEGARRAP